MDLKNLIVNKAIANGDGMAKDTSLETYLNTWQNALQSIVQSMHAARLAESSVSRVLDYACGYGRVLRWLQAGFPEADLLGVDIDRKAVASAAQTLGVSTRVLDPSLAEPLDKPFDLIWVGSLFTHLPETEAERVFKYLNAHLSSRGVLVFTAHGYFVERRLREREKTYNLPESRVVQILQDFDKGKFAFAPYEQFDHYGISISAPHSVVSMLQRAGLTPVYFHARGWANHQDTYGCVKIRP